MDKGREAEVKLIALTVSQEFSREIDQKLDGVHGRITELATDVATIKGQMSKGSYLPIPRNVLSGMDYLKIVSLILGITGAFTALFRFIS